MYRAYALFMDFPWSAGRMPRTPWCAENRRNPQFWISLNVSSTSERREERLHFLLHRVRRGKRACDFLGE